MRGQSLRSLEFCTCTAQNLVLNSCVVARKLFLPSSTTYLDTLVVLSLLCCCGHSLVGKIITRFEERGYKLAGLKLKQADEALLKKHYK